MATSDVADKILGGVSVSSESIASMEESCADMVFAFAEEDQPRDICVVRCRRVRLTLRGVNGVVCLWVWGHVCVCMRVCAFVRACE